MNYIGEWFITGQIGHLCTLISLVAAIVATISYYCASLYNTTSVQLQPQNPESEKQGQAWLKLARGAFYIHATAVALIFIILFYLIFNHRFEYKYVWQHSSLDLPLRYMISCFWEGQEGSFLLWTIWHAVLGLVLIRNAKRWEAPTMTFVCATQIFLAVMLIGIYFFGYKLGSSPFILMRDDTPLAPIFGRADYVSMITDGNGLNPLLQNYWMVIHPPVLFLGFAGVIVPFAYALAALWQRDYTNWALPTLKWTLFAGGVLGLGILMGGAWAYESLTFGGFWAWDPVENASLVPWLVLIAGLHTLLVYKHTGYALKATLILLPLSFLFILYSTFLTRSGVLGETSVHSFTDLGMSGQLLAFLFFFIAITKILLFTRWRSIPDVKKEESAYSREFCMFIGALLLLLIGGMISVDTSWPVINKLLGTNTTITDAVQHYNRYAIWFAILIAILSGAVQFLRFKTSDLKKFAASQIIPLTLTAVLTVAIAWAMGMKYWPYMVMLFASTYAFIANATYFGQKIKSGKMRVAGASVAHIGFALILFGTLISQGYQDVISINTMGIEYGKDFDAKTNAENILLYKNQPVQMGQYWVTYKGEEIKNEIDSYFPVLYEKKQAIDDAPTESFTLRPHAQKNPKMGLVANPSTKHYLHKDVFTHITSFADKTQTESETAEQLKEIELKPGDTAVVNRRLIILNSISPQPQDPRYIALPGDIAAAAHLTVTDLHNPSQTVEVAPVYYIRNSQENFIETTIEEQQLSIRFLKIYPDKNAIKLGLLESTAPQDFIIMKAVVFPYINVLWIGCVVLFIGFMMSLRQRYLEAKRKKQSN